MALQMIFSMRGNEKKSTHFVEGEMGLLKGWTKVSTMIILVIWSVNKWLFEIEKKIKNNKSTWFIVLNKCLMKGKWTMNLYMK